MMLKQEEIKKSIYNIDELRDKVENAEISYIKALENKWQIIIDVYINKTVANGKEQLNDLCDKYYYELIRELKKINKNFREYLKHVPITNFPIIQFK